jgi:hypothetical protein
LRKEKLPSTWDESKYFLRSLLIFALFIVQEEIKRRKKENSKREILFIS